MVARGREELGSARGGASREPGGVGEAGVRPRTRRDLRRLHSLAAALVARDYRQPLTLEHVAGALCASPRQVQRAYAEVDGGSFSEDLARTRLTAAAQLLAEQAIPVALVGRLVGYRQASAFAAAFRRRYGLTPAAFRTAARAAGSALAGGPQGRGSSLPAPAGHPHSRRSDPPGRGASARG